MFWAGQIALGIVRNTATGRFHPMFYREYPLPGPGPHPIVRFKSGGHHTEGLETRSEAEAYNEEQRAKLVEMGQPCRDGLIADWEWDGEGMPVDVVTVAA